MRSLLRLGTSRRCNSTQAASRKRLSSCANRSGSCCWIPTFSIYRYGQTSFHAGRGAWSVQVAIVHGTLVKFQCRAKRASRTSPSGNDRFQWTDLLAGAPSVSWPHCRGAMQGRAPSNALPARPLAARRKQRGIQGDEKADDRSGCHGPDPGRPEPHPLRCVGQSEPSAGRCGRAGPYLRRVPVCRPDEGRA